MICWRGKPDTYLHFLHSFTGWLSFSSQSWPPIYWLSTIWVTQKWELTDECIFSRDLAKSFIWALFHHVFSKSVESIYSSKLTFNFRLQWSANTGMWVYLTSLNSASCTFIFHWQYAILFLTCHLCNFSNDQLCSENVHLDHFENDENNGWWTKICVIAIISYENGNNSPGHSFFWPGQFARGSSAAIKWQT